MAQQIKKVEKAYDTIADWYAKKFIHEHDDKPRDQSCLLKFSQMVGSRKPVWDFGCGPGHTANHLSSLGVSVSGLDLSDEMLDQARRHFPKLAFEKGDLLNLHFHDNSIAAIVSFYAIVHFTKEQAAMAFREMYRVLEPEGILLLAFHIGDEVLHVDEFEDFTLDIDFMFFPTDFVIPCLQECGFTILETIEREPYPDVEYKSRRAYVFAKRVFVKVKQ